MPSDTLASSPSSIVSIERFVFLRACRRAQLRQHRRKLCRAARRVSPRKSVLCSFELASECGFAYTVACPDEQPVEHRLERMVRIPSSPPSSTTSSTPSNDLLSSPSIIASNGCFVFLSSPPSTTASPAPSDASPAPSDALSSSVEHIIYDVMKGRDRSTMCFKCTHLLEEIRGVKVVSRRGQSVRSTFGSRG